MLTSVSILNLLMIYKLDLSDYHSPGGFLFVVIGLSVVVIERNNI